jgi:hypothetical protein
VLSLAPQTLEYLEGMRDLTLSTLLIFVLLNLLLSLSLFLWLVSLSEPLLWGLHSQTSQCNLKIVVVPTEAPILTQFLHDHWFVDKSAEKDLGLSLVTISSDIFLSHCCHLEQLCTKEWQTNKLSEGYSTSALQRYCEVNSPLHYHLTDLGLETIHPNRKEEDLMRSSILQSASTFLIMPSPISTPEPCFFGDITPSACYS